jgi:phosphatidylinositol glycan class P protein
MSNAAFVMYILWAFLPAAALEAVGVSYYPSRWWALVIPSYLVVAVCYAFAALAGYNTGVLTHPLSALESVVDVGGMVAAFTEGEGEGGEVKGAAPGSERWEDMVKGQNAGQTVDWKRLWGRGTDAVLDVPIGGVCEVLYGEDREREEWEVSEED